jgi:hypothetical protein
VTLGKFGMKLLHPSIELFGGRLLAIRIVPAVNQRLVEFVLSFLFLLVLRFDL